MSIQSDSELINALETLDDIINKAVSNVKELHKETWTKDSLNQIRIEIGQARQALEKSRDQAAQEFHALESASFKASEKIALLKQVSSEGNYVYLKLLEQEPEGRELLNSLIKSIQDAQQSKTQFDAILQRIDFAENILLAELDAKQELHFKLKNQMTEILNRIGGYDSVRDLVLTIRYATETLQYDQEFMLQEFERINRKIDNLIREQRKPWWWPSNWWR